MKKVLIVDDQKVNQIMLSNYLNEFSQANFEVTVMSSGEECLKALEGDFPYDLVLLDLEMAEVGGLQVLERVRRVKPKANFIIVSAHTEGVLITKCLCLGASDYMVKPVKKEKFDAVIKDACGELAIAN